MLRFSSLHGSTVLATSDALLMTETVHYANGQCRLHAYSFVYMLRVTGPGPEETASMRPLDRFLYELLAATSSHRHDSATTLHENRIHGCSQ